MSQPTQPTVRPVKPLHNQHGPPTPNTPFLLLPTPVCMYMADMHHRVGLGVGQHMPSLPCAIPSAEGAAWRFEPGRAGD
jgi:hypothetical protein